MENPRGIGKRSNNNNVEEIIPSFAWSDDVNAHYLLVDLPGFKTEEVRLEVDNSGHITVSGERLVHYDKYIYFEQPIKLPDDADSDNITGEFEGEILHVTVPKKQIVAEKSEKNKGDVLGEHNKSKTAIVHEPNEGNEKAHTSKKKLTNHVSNFKKKMIKKWEQEGGLFERTIDLFKKNKAVAVTAVLAFSLGVFVARRFE